MSPADFVNEIVLPTLSELRDDRRSRRRAYLACVSVFHVKDYLRKVGEHDIETRMRAATGDAFDVVRGVCNGVKHLQTDGSHVVAFKAGDDWDVPPAFVGEFTIGVSYLGDEIGGREIATPSGAADIYGAASATLRAFVQIFPAHLGHCDLSRL